MHRVPLVDAGDIQLSAQDFVGLLDPSTIPGGSPPPSQGLQQAASGEVCPPFAAAALNELRVLFWPLLRFSVHIQHPALPV